jgi:uncharacterized protein
MKLARIAAILVTLLSVVLVTRLRLSSDLTQLFPQTAEAEALARVTRVFGGGDVALVLLRGEDPDAVERAADEAAARMRELPSIAQIVTGPPEPREIDPTAAWRWAGPSARQKLAHALTEAGMRERIRDTRALLLAPGASEVADWLSRDPLRLATIPWEGSVELAAGARATPGGAFVGDAGRARLLVVEPRGHALDAGDAARFVAEAEAALGLVRAAHDAVQIDLTGGHVIAKQTESLIRTDMERSSVLSIVLAAAMFVLTFRRPRALLAVLPPLAAGTLWTTALAAVVYPRLSAVATAFAAVVVGVGVDTGIHVYGRLLAARRAGHPPSEAAAIARRETWRPTMGAAVAAGGAFACLALSEIAGMQQLGVLCAAGEILTAVAILMFVPEVGAWLERGSPPSLPRLARVSALTSTRRRATFALALSAAAVLVAVLVGAPKLDHGVVALDAKTLPAMATYESIYEIFGGTRGQLLAISADPDPERARARADAVAEAAEQLSARGVIAGYDALGQVAPSLPAQRMRLAERDRLDLPGKRELLRRVLEEEGFAVDAFEEALGALERPAEELSDPVDELGPGVAWVKRRHLGKDERGTLVVTFVRLRHQPADDAEARAVLRAADPEAILTGFTELEEGLRDTLARDLPRVLLAASGIVVLVLGATLRRARGVVLAGLVLVVEIAIVLLAARLLGVRWHVYDALVLPVLLGITLDEALFLLEATKRHAAAPDPIESALAEQAPLATATALTTAAGFGALVVCQFEGLADVGKVGALGSTVGLVAAFVVIPAGMRLALRGRPRAPSSRSSG